MTVTIGDLPFDEGDPVEVLRLDREDPDFTGTGFCRLEHVWLESRDGEPPLRLDEALVVALHSPEEPEELDGDIELEFFDQGVSVLLSKFLERRLPDVIGDERAVVLALCNPRHAIVPAPPSAGARPVWFGLGDVVSWLDEDDTGQRHITLEADVWRRAA